jgi:hypothetical protein
MPRTPLSWLATALLLACGGHPAPEAPAPPPPAVPSPADAAAPVLDALAPPPEGPRGDAAASAGDAAPELPADAAPASIASATPATVVLDGPQLAMIRQKLAAGDATLTAQRAALLARADRALTAGPWSVMNKTTTPPSGNKHDYLSLARYYWPTPGAANGCPFIHRDGQTNPDTSSARYDHASRHAAMDALQDLALAWYFSGDRRYSERAALVARTWFLDPATAMNPNVNFGEGVPCLRDGTDTGVLNWTELVGQALDGVAILDSGAAGWTPADRAAMRTWLTTFLGWLQTNKLALEESRGTNNHGTWYDVGVSAIQVYLGQTAAAKTLLQNSTRRIASQIGADGSQPEELARTNSWGYSNWNLEGFCRLAATARHAGVDLWGYSAPGGGTIARAIDYLIDGATKGQSAWPHPQMIAFEPAWALPLLHAAAELAGDARARAALPMVTAPPGTDLWSLLPVCTVPAIQID